MPTEIFVIGFEEETKITLTDEKLPSGEKNKLVKDLIKFRPPNSNGDRSNICDNLGIIIDKGITTSIQCRATVYSNGRSHYTRSNKLILTKGQEAVVIFAGYGQSLAKNAVICIRNISTP